jgi:hypothetical protein
MLPLIRKCSDHLGDAAQPARRHRDPAAELAKGEGRGAWDLSLSLAQPLKAPAALLP